MVRSNSDVLDLGYFALGLGLLAVYLAAMAAVLFGAAGTFAVPMFWALSRPIRGPVCRGQRRRLSAEPGSHRFSPCAVSVSRTARQTFISTPCSASSTIFSLTRNPALASTASAERPAVLPPLVAFFQRPI